MSEYEAKAQRWLRETGIAFAVSKYPDAKCPEWCDGKHVHGDRYRVALTRDDGSAHTAVRFDFWNSQHDSKLGKTPTAYDVLACISGDVHCPETFEDFCGEYGYDTDSRKAEATFKRGSKFARELRAFLRESEIESLSEIN